jgi:hypothetical protein
MRSGNNISFPFGSDFLPVEPNVCHLLSDEIELLTVTIDGLKIEDHDGVSVDVNKAEANLKSGPFQWSFTFF